MINDLLTINSPTWQGKETEDLPDGGANKTENNGQPPTGQIEIATPQNYVPNQLIVKLKPGWESIGLNEVAALGETVDIRETTKTLDIQLWNIEGMSVEEAIAFYSQLPGIEYVEPNYILSLDTIPNDPDFEQLWGLHNTGQSGGKPDADIDAPEAWNLQTGSDEIIIGVIDTGVDYTHPDLSDNIWTNPGEIAENGIDDDGNGYIDDFYGWDFAYNDNDPMDEYGHGTHVAGTIAAVGNNDMGTVGVNWNVQIMPIKFLDDSGYGSLFNAIQAIEYAVLMGANLTNNSWGGGGYSQALYDAIAAAGEAGQLFIAAAGNNDGNNNDLSPYYPSSYDLDNIIAVAATDRYDDLSSFSNYGPTSVDLGAPGSDIYSTVPNDGYATYSGTSMATPHVSGVAALVWAEHPELTALEVKQLLLETSEPIDALQGKTVSGGRLNAYNALVGSNGGKIAGSKWNDLNANGIWETDEPALANWTIYLDLDNDGQFDLDEPFTSTDTDGRYAFNFLLPGIYTVAEVMQPGWSQTHPGGPGTYQVELEAQEVVSGLNFANYLSNPAAIHGSKWNDVDGDGEWDSDENGLAGWTIYLDQNQNFQLDSGDIFTVTDDNGNYSFSGLLPGTYTVAELLLEGWEQTHPGAGTLVFSDPEGDTFGYDDAIDIESLSGSISGGNLTLTMNFFTSIAPPSWGLYNSVVGYWDLDLDQDVATGSYSHQSYLAPPGQQGGPLGVDVYIDLFSEQYHPGLVELIETSNHNNIGLASINYSSNSLQIQIPLDLLDDDGLVNYGAIIGSFNGPTDAAANNELGSTSAAGIYTIELEPDEIASDINFGNRQLPTGEIHGSKWLDINGNGIWQAGEPGLAGWTIYLDQNRNGQLDGGENSTVTDANGNYSFSGLVPGSYNVAEVLEVNWQPTYPAPAQYRWSDSNQAGGPSFNWIDISGIGTPIFLEDDGYIEVALPFTFPFFGQEKDKITISANGYLTFSSSGNTFTNTPIADVSEPNDLMAPFWDDLNPGSGGSIYYYHALEENQFIVQYQGVSHLIYGGSYTFEVILNANGSILYQYDNMQGILNSATVGIENAAGTEGVEIAYNQNYVQDDLAISIELVPTNTPLPHTVDLRPGEILTDINFGNWQPVTLSGSKWHDVNENGIWDSGEPSLAGWTIYLDNNGNGQLDLGETFTTTNSFGSYSFTLNAGTYTVAEVLLPGWAQTAPLSGSYPVSLAPGEEADGLNFGNRMLPGEIHGTLWNDQNGNGVHDTGEPALANWFVYLDTNQNGQLDAGETKSHTDIYGHYAFTGLMPDTYTVGAVLSPHWQQTYPLLSLVNGGLETGDFSNWQTLGDTSIQTANYGSGPTKGIYQALLTNGIGSLSAAELESSLGLPEGSLDSLGNGDATQGSAMMRSITVSAGSQLSFDWNFLTNESTPGSFNDFAFVTISSVDTLANTYDSFILSPTPFNKETGFATFDHTFSTGGTFVVAVGVVDVRDSRVDSGLLVDNFSLTTTAPEFHTVALSPGEMVTGMDFDNHQVKPPTIIYKTKGNDNLLVGDSPTQAYSLGGKDLIDGSDAIGGNAFYGGAGNDTLLGNYYDQLYGGLGDDLLDTSEGNGFNSLYGDDGRDTLLAGSNDWLDGGAGDDLLYAGQHSSYLTGGVGADRFWIVNGGLLPLVAHQVFDFEPAVDRLTIQGLGIAFAELAITQIGDDTAIAALNTDLVILRGVQAHTLTRGDFILAV